MDKETLSNYGWIVICVLVLAVMIALATPFGTFVADAVKSTTQGLFDVNQNALNSTGLINIGDQSFGEGGNGGNGGAGESGGSETEVQLEPGLYQTGSNYGTLLYTWDELINKRWITQDGMILSGHASNMAGDLVFPDTLTTVLYRAFDGAINSGMALTGLYFPKTIVSLQDSAFGSCKGLTTVKFANGICLERIGYGVFSDCSALKSVEFGKDSQLTSIGDVAFVWCSSLENLTIPAGLESIGGRAFHDCTSLKTINFGGTTTDWNNVTKASNWNLNCGEITVICTDGTVTVPAWS